MINDETIVYLVEICKYCTIDTYTKMTHEKVYDLYKQFCRKNSITPLAKDSEEYLGKYRCHFFNMTHYTMRYTNFGRLHDIPSSSMRNSIPVCTRCKEKGAHLPDELEKLRKENGTLKNRVKKLELLIVSANLNKDELT